MVVRIIIFLLLNFAALGLGSLFTTDGVVSDWYLNLNKAPWTPPGWVFGAAWTTIMICFSIYMAFAWDSVKNRNTLIALYVVQWILNVGWNPIFFNLRNLSFGLVVITALTILMIYFLFRYWSVLKTKSLLVVPYCIWLVIATSLNGYALFNN